MDLARIELGRLSAYKNPHAWAVPDGERGKHQYFFLDKDTPSAKEGDSSLLRLLALHACPSTVEGFLHHAADDNFCGSQVSEGGDCQRLERILASNGKGVSPLHMAIHRNSWYVGEIVRLLLRLDPSLVSRHMHPSGSFPLHVCMANNLTIDSQVVEDLLIADPLIVRKEDIHGDNPLSLLYKNVLRFRWARDWETQDVPPVTMVSDSSWMTVIAPDQFRDFSFAMIRAAYPSRLEYSPAPLEWHQVCSFPRCPPLLIRLLASELSAADLLGADAQGCLPLHRVAQSPALTSHCIPRHLVSSSTLELVLDLQPGAAWVADDNGKYPIHYALQNPTLSIRAISKLLQESPMEAFLTPDCATGLLPFQQAAARAGEADSEDELTLIYRFLRTQPTVSHHTPFYTQH
jgi:ankyrin repeat protein